MSLDPSPRQSVMLGTASPLTEADASEIRKLLEWMDEEPRYRRRLVDGASERAVPKVCLGIKGPA
jgi:hypothetical protein